MEHSTNLIKLMNLDVFYFFNQNFSTNTFDKIAISLSILADPHFIHYHFAAICIFSLALLYQKRKDDNDLKETFIKTFCSATTFLASGVSLAIGLILKYYTEIARPFCNLENIHTLKYVTDKITCNHSFPSGHTTLSIMLTVSLWPLFNRSFKIISIFFIALTIISRMSSGAHYPIDIIGAFAITLPLSVYAKNKINYLVRYYETKWEIFNHICKKINHLS